MKNQVKITKTEQGKIELNLPEKMTGKQLKQWKLKNRAVVEVAKQINESIEEMDLPINPNFLIKPQIKISNFNGKLTLEIPQGMTGEQLMNWKAKNKAIIALAKDAPNGYYSTINLK